MIPEMEKLKRKVAAIDAAIKQETRRAEMKIAPQGKIQEIMLIIFKSTTVDWGWGIYPALKKDRALFYHCSGLGAEFILTGGVVQKKVLQLIIPVFELHGYKPVLVGINNADWDLSLLPNEAGHLNPPVSIDTIMNGDLKPKETNATRN
jgi:hypothetical protein